MQGLLHFTASWDVFLPISSAQWGGRIPKGSECGEPATCPVLMCQGAAPLQLQETWTPAWWKRLSSLKQEQQNNNLPKPLGVFGQKSLGQHGKQMCSEHISSSHGVAPAAGRWGHKQGQVSNAGWHYWMVLRDKHHTSQALGLQSPSFKKLHLPFYRYSSFSNSINFCSSLIKNHFTKHCRGIWRGEQIPKTNQPIKGSSV